MSFVAHHGFEVRADLDFDLAGFQVREIVRRREAGVLEIDRTFAHPHRFGHFADEFGFKIADAVLVGSETRDQLFEVFLRLVSEDPEAPQRPWETRLSTTLASPSLVRGPVDFSELRRFASIYFWWPFPNLLLKEKTPSQRWAGLGSAFEKENSISNYRIACRSKRFPVSC